VDLPAIYIYHQFCNFFVLVIVVDGPLQVDFL